MDQGLRLQASTQVPSLVGELRSHIPHDVARKFFLKKKQRNRGPGRPLAQGVDAYEAATWCSVWLWLSQVVMLLLNILKEEVSLTENLKQENKDHLTARQELLHRCSL